MSEEMTETSYMLMSLPGGNAIDSFSDRGDACESLLRILATEPEAGQSVGLVAFDAGGMAVRRLWPDPEKE